MSMHQHDETRMETPPRIPPAPRHHPDLQVVHDTPTLSAPPKARPVKSAARRPAPKPSRLRLADDRGLTGLGAVSLVVLVAALAGAYDGHRAGDGLGWVFAVAFLLGCVGAALFAHTEDLGAVAILPPLAFMVGALACAAFRPSVSGVSFTHQVVNEVLIAMLLGAPSLFIAEIATLVTTGLRGQRHRTLQKARRTP